MRGGILSLRFDLDLSLTRGCNLVRVPAMGEWDWQIQAKCKDLSVEESERLFFVNKNRYITAARKFCSDCSVVELCLNAALSFESAYIWAGTTEKERIRLRGPKTPKNSYRLPAQPPQLTQEQIRLVAVAKLWTEDDLQDALELVEELLVAL